MPYMLRKHLRLFLQKKILTIVAKVLEATLATSLRMVGGASEAATETSVADAAGAAMVQNVVGTSAAR